MFGKARKSTGHVWLAISGISPDEHTEHGVQLTSKAPLTDSSHKSIMNSSNAMDSLSTLMRRWHNLHYISYGLEHSEGRLWLSYWGRKNSISS